MENPDDQGVHISILENGKYEHLLTYDEDTGHVNKLLSFIYDEIGTSNNRPLEKWYITDYDGVPIYSIDSMIYEGKYKAPVFFNIQ
jgi:hypothetical protein